MSLSPGARLGHTRISADGQNVTFLEHPFYGNNASYVSVARLRGAQVERLTDLNSPAWTASPGPPTAKRFGSRAARSSSGTARGPPGSPGSIWRPARG